ncbi:MAG: type II toxin-antitoxin system RelE/ParE family toxin [Flavobacteriales bacterium]|nr:type II toxin-antitoxin system RelE/ParE family toxin [Flavobacteriales bacterium]
MKTSSARRFEKDLEDILDSKLLLKIAFLLEGVEQAKIFSQIKNTKQLKGAKDFYRIRIGHYRIGFLYRNNEIVFLRFGHRQDFYNLFP